MSSGNLWHLKDLDDIVLNPSFSIHVGFQILPKNLNSNISISLYFLSICGLGFIIYFIL